MCTGASVTSARGRSVVSQSDFPTLSNPTRRKSRRGSSGNSAPVEAEVWPEESQVVTLMSFGFTYQEAYHTSPRDYRRYAGINAAFSIPPDEREGGVRLATQADVDRLFQTI